MLVFICSACNIYIYIYCMYVCMYVCVKPFKTSELYIVWHQMPKDGGAGSACRVISVSSLGHRLGDPERMLQDGGSMVMGEVGYIYSK